MKTEEQHIEYLKASLEKEHGRTITQEEAIQAYRLVKLLAQITVDNVFIEADHLKKLEENPEGFHLEESGTCGVCG